MPEIIIKLLVEGGKASAGPPLGPALAPLKININEIVAKINEKTKEFAGISVPVELAVNTQTKEFSISVGTPPTSQLLKKELKLETLAKAPWNVFQPKEEGKPPEEFHESVSFETIKKIAKLKQEAMSTEDEKSAVKQVLGTCLSCGVSVDNRNPKEILKEIDNRKIAI